MQMLVEKTLMCIIVFVAAVFSCCWVAVTKPHRRKTSWPPCTGPAISLEITAMAKAKHVKTRDSLYDGAQQPPTPEDMAAYLDAWFVEAPDDVAGTTRALGDIARAKGMTQVAKETGLSRESLYRALTQDGNPSFATI